MDEGPYSSDALQRRFDALLLYTRGILFELDEEGTYRYVRASEAGLLARPPQELLGKTVIEVLGERDGRPFIELARRVLRSGQEERYDYVLQVPEGPRDFEAHMLPIAGTPGTVTLLVRDVTEERRLKAKLVDAERLASTGLLAAAVGHEINNPLAFIANVIARLDGLSGEELSTAAAQLKDGTRRIAAIVESLRLLGPAAAQEPIQVVDVTHALHAAVELTRLRIQDRARLSVTTVRPVHVRGVEGKLCQVFVNLLLNAAQAIVAGSPNSNSVAVAVDTTPTHVEIRVSDTGVGIKDRDKSKLFTPFFSTRSSEHGTGLGLYVTKTIVDSIGGTISIESVVGQGTTVIVRLPVVEAPAKKETAPPPHKPLEHRPRLLVIDDEKAFLVSLRFAVRPFAELEPADTAEEALRLLADKRAKYDLILCDLMMPGMDGVAFHAEVAKSRPELLPLIVFTTGGAYTDRAQSFLETVKPRVLQKPFFPEQLLELLTLTEVTTRSP